MKKSAKETTAATGKDDLLREARKRAQKGIDAERENRLEAIEDLKMLRGKQEDHWTLEALAAREGRPCLTINKLPQHLDQVTGEHRQNKIAINVSPVDSAADPATAEVLEGLIRNIEAQSHAGDAYDCALEGAAACGKGAFRILTEYADDDIFDQNILIRRITNQFSVIWDPSAKEKDKSDSKWCIIFDDVDRDDYKAQYPGKTPLEFDNAKDELASWANRDTVRVAEYFRKVPEKRKIYQLSDGSVVREVPEGERAVKTREVQTHRVEWYKISGDDILEGPITLPTKYIPVIPVEGKELFIGNERVVRGVVRHARDPQRMYNYSRSAGMETIALSPKQPYFVTPKQIEGHDSQWRQMHTRNFPYVLYNPDPNMRQKPYREQPVQLSSAIVNEIALSDNEIKDTTEVQDASLGKVSNERSGLAIRERRRSGSIANFAYSDNLARAIEYAGKILIDMIPRVYDTARIVRIIGKDGQQKDVPINQPLENDPTKKIFDLTVGKYDATVTVGPASATQRAEAVESMIAFVQAVPAAGPMVMDIIAKNSDWPGAQELADRLRKILPPGLNESPPAAPGGPIPPAGALPQPGGLPAGPPAAPGPSPLDELKIQQEAEKLKGLQLDNQLKEIKLKAEPENLKAMIAEMLQEMMAQGGAQ